MGKQYNTELQAKVETYMKETGISQAKLAPMMNLSGAVLSQYRRSVYDKGDVGDVERKEHNKFPWSGCSSQCPSNWKHCEHCFNYASSNTPGDFKCGFWYQWPDLSGIASYRRAGVGYRCGCCGACPCFQYDIRWHW